MQLAMGNVKGRNGLQAANSEAKAEHSFLKFVHRQGWVNL